MVIKKLFTIILLLFIYSLICCKKQEVNSVKKHTIVKEKSIPIKMEQDILPSSIIEKYKLQKYFNHIVKGDKILRKDIIRIYNNKTEIEYKEKKLEKNLILCQFIFRGEVQYDYIFKNDKLLFKLISDLVKSKIEIEYKNWNNDKKPEFIERTESCMAGACEQFFITKSIYEVKDDTIVKIISLPIKNVLCQFGEISLIEEYQYNYYPKTKELKSKKIIGKGDCNSQKIKTIDSVLSKKLTLKQFDNKINF